MSVYVENIGSQKIKYQNHENVQFDSLEEYLVLAKKAISAFANNFYGGLSRKMLSDEDAVSNIAYAIMLADWRYDENYKGTRAAKKTRYSYRNQCALWAIQSHVTKNKKNKKKTMKNKVYSLDHSIDDENHTNYYSYINDTTSVEPIQEMINDEEARIKRHKINKLVETARLSERQREYIELYYYKDMTFDQIGQKYSLTREAVRQSIKKAILQMQEAGE